MYIRTYIHGCIRVCMHVCMCLGTWVYAWGACVCTGMGINICVCICVLQLYPDPFIRPRPDLELCSVWTRYAGNSKTDLRDDPEIRTGSCSEDQITI